MTPPEQRSLRRRELVGLALAAALVPLNSTMIAVALPDVAEDFDIATGTAGTLVTIYLVVMLVGQPTMGRVIDLVGGRRALFWALGGFTALSAVTPLAGTFPLLVAGRALQAAFGAALMPSAQALLRSLTPPERRGRSFGLLGSFIGTGAATGPVIGGVVTELSGWQGIFFVNLPITTIALVSVLSLPKPAGGAGRQATRGPSMWSTLRQRTFLAAFSVQATTTLAQYSLLLVVPSVLDARGWSSGQVGLALTSLTAGMVLMGPAGGRHGDLHGRRRPAALGVWIASAASLVAAFAVADVPALLVAAVTLFGFGLGFALPSVQTAALEAVPEELAGSASGMFSMGRHVGSIPASLLFAALVSGDGGGATLQLTIATVGMGAAIVATGALPGQAASDQLIPGQRE